MDNNFEERLSRLPDEELEKYILPNSIYVPASIETAVNILKNRGREFSTQEIETINLIIEQKSLVKVEESPSYWGKYWEKNTVQDENAPELYSRFSIYLFSMLFSVAVGSILQSINCNTVKSKRGFYLTIIFGFTFTIIQIIALSYLEDQMGGTIFGLPPFFCGLGAIILDDYFWNKFVGETTSYRKKAIQKPLIICILVSIPIIALIILTN